MSERATEADTFLRLSARHDTSAALIWSVLLVDVREAQVAALVLALEGQGFWTEAVLNDPDVVAVYFIQMSETRVHDASSFSLRADQVRACALAFGATVADWSARDVRLSNRS